MSTTPILGSKRRELDWARVSMVALWVLAGAVAASRILVPELGGSEIVRPPNIVWIPNSAAGGTSLNQLVKLTGAPSTGIETSTLDTYGVVGICVSGCGVAAASARASIANWGNTSCAFDGGTTAGDYIGISSAADGNCTDKGAAYPASGQVLGRVLSTNGGAGTYPVILFGPDIEAGGGVPGGTGVSWLKYSVVKVADGTIRAVALNAGGSGYTAPTDVLTVVGGVGGTISVDTVDGKGVILTYTLTAGGTGYSSTVGATVTGGTGTLATFDTTSSGSWTVNGAVEGLADAALTQDVILVALAAKGHVTDYRIKVGVRCTGATTALTGLGTTASNVLYRAANYNIDQVVSDTAIATGPPTAGGSDTHAGTNVVGSLVTTVQNVDQLVVGCTVDYWLLWGVLP